MVEAYVVRKESAGIQFEPGVKNDVQRLSKIGNERLTATKYSGIVNLEQECTSRLIYERFLHDLDASQADLLAL